MIVRNVDQIEADNRIKFETGNMVTLTNNNNNNNNNKAEAAHPQSSLFILQWKCRQNAPVN